MSGFSNLNLISVTDTPKLFVGSSMIKSKSKVDQFLTTTQQFKNIKFLTFVSLALRHDDHI